MNTTEHQLKILNFPPEISRHFSLFSSKKIDEFTNHYVQKLIIKESLSNVQSSIDNDSNPYDFSINYLTSIMMLGILYELFNQSLATNDQMILNQRLELLAWAINISVATELKSNGIKNIPSIADGNINIYFTWDNMEIIIQSILPVAKQIQNTDTIEMGNYLNNLINSKL